ncbi:hypothetical protein U9M48_004639 [Paspalum notatum var. saurae]
MGVQPEPIPPWAASPRSSSMESLKQAPRSVGYCLSWKNSTSNGLKTKGGGVQGKWGTKLLGEAPGMCFWSCQSPGVKSCDEKTAIYQDEIQNVLHMDVSVHL